MDTDAVPIYNNYENRNSMPSKQVSVSQKQEQKQEISQIQKNNNTIQNQKRDINREQKKIGFIITVFLKKRCLM